MTEQEINKRIAEACPDLVEWHDGVPYWRGMWSAAGEGNEHFAEFKPFTDLNAIHEAEKSLGATSLQRYLNRLALICGGFLKSIHATAPQRAGAFMHIRCFGEDA